MSGPSGIPFGHFQLIKRLARGGMAEVFLARQSGPEGFDRLVALKRILPHLADSNDFVRMFHDEARLAARLSHPNIVHIYEFGKVEEHYFIAMEYVEGVHAGHIIKKGATERLPPALIARIGADACGALYYAHNLRDEGGRDLHIVHRDISPPNLMISYDGIVKLVDFGIAKAVSHVEQTRPGVVKGKFAYMSPEQTTAKKLDGRSDVFSLALLLWELLAGRVALDRTDPVDAMRRIRDGELPSLSTVRPDLPGALTDAIDTSLSVRPEDRYSAAQLGVVLEEFIKASPELATSMQLAEWVRERFPRVGATGEQPALDRPVGTVAATSSTMAATPPGTEAATPTPAPRPATSISGDGSQTNFVAELSEADADPPTAVIAPRPDEATDVDTSSVRPSARRGRTGRIAAAATATLATIVALTLALRNGESEAEPERRSTTTVTTITADAGSATDAQPVADAPPALDAAPARAVVEIITHPEGALAVVDDDHALTTPAKLDDLAPGHHTLHLALDGHHPVDRQLDLSPGEQRTVDVTLEQIEPPEPEKTRRPDRRSPRKRRPGHLTVRTTPYSVVYLRGRRLGVTPFANLELPAGTHTLTFKNPDRAPHRRRVRIRPGKTTKLNFVLP